jgi:hypothetical protein
MAGQQLAQQQYQQNRYFDKVNQAQAMIGAGAQNIGGGLSMAGTSAIQSKAPVPGQSPTGNSSISSLFKSRKLKELGSNLGSYPDFNNQAYLQSLGLS